MSTLFIINDLPTEQRMSPPAKLAPRISWKPRFGGGCNVQHRRMDLLAHGIKAGAGMTKIDRWHSLRLTA